MARAHPASLVSMIAIPMICGMAISCILGAGSPEFRSTPGRVPVAAQPGNTASHDAGAAGIEPAIAEENALGEPRDPIEPAIPAEDGLPESSAPAREPGEERSERDQDGADSGGACCKTCRRGKACGDSCIARHMVCRKGPGCACDQ
jgi:hypothetical protein